MKPKWIFLDIDGTLTRPGENVPPESALTAIRRAQENGHKVALCSGRNYGMLAPLLHYGFDAVIASAGGYVLYGNELVYNCPMTAEQQEKVLRVFEESGVFRTIEGKNGSYTDEGYKQFLSQCSGGNSELLRWQKQIESSLGIRPMAEYDGEPIYKLVFMSRSMDDLRHPMALLSDEFNFCIQGTNEAGITNGELISRQFNKGTAVERLCEYSGIPLADTIAFGDSMNDLEMLEMAALGICMGNGSEALKEKADAVCPSVDEDGLYKAFEKLGLF